VFGLLDDWSQQFQDLKNKAYHHHHRHHRRHHHHHPHPHPPPKSLSVCSWESDAVSKVFGSLDDWSQQFQDLKNKALGLADNCVSFGMSPPRFEGQMMMMMMMMM
jgi:hypothetical protein